MYAENPAVTRRPHSGSTPKQGEQQDDGQGNAEQPEQ